MSHIFQGKIVETGKSDEQTDDHLIKFREEMTANWERACYFRLWRKCCEIQHKNFKPSRKWDVLLLLETLFASDKQWKFVKDWARAQSSRCSDKQKGKTKASDLQDKFVSDRKGFFFSDVCAQALVRYLEEKDCVRICLWLNVQQREWEKIHPSQRLRLMLVLKWSRS